MGEMFLRFLSAVLLSLLLTFSADAQPGAIIKKSDQLDIALLHPEFDAPKIDSTYSVSASGVIKLPRCDGAVEAAGLTTKELEQALEKAFKDAGIYEEPVFSVRLSMNCCEGLDPSVLAVGGEVKSPKGSISLRDGMRLSQAVAAAGGFTEYADLKHVKLIRLTTEKVYDVQHLKEDGSNNPLLKGGDTIHVPIVKDPPASLAKGEDSAPDKAAVATQASSKSKTKRSSGKRRG